MNVQIYKTENNKFSLYNSSNRNEEHQTDFSLENELTCFNTKFQKKKGKLWTYTYANNAKALVDYILMNKEWINSPLNCEACSSFEGVFSDRRTDTPKKRLCQRRMTTQTTKTTHYD